MAVTSKVNPGSFTARRPLRPRVVLSRIADALKHRQLRYAVVGGIVDTVNLWSASIGAHLAPRVHCPCCGYVGYAFVHLHSELRTAWNSACPGCDSRSRHRGLVRFVPALLRRTARGARLLHIAPEAVLRTAIEPGVKRYDTTDLVLSDVSYPREDLTALSFAGATYDVILCNHVLEHIADDNAAIRELARVLTDDGVAIVTIPGEYERTETVVFPDLSRNGHYRDYGMAVVEQFRRAFHDVEVVDLHAFDAGEHGLRHGIRRGETAFVLSRPARR